MDEYSLKPELTENSGKSIHIKLRFKKICPSVRGSILPVQSTVVPVCTTYFNTKKLCIYPTQSGIMDFVCFLQENENIFLYRINSLVFAWRNCVLCEVGYGVLNIISINLYIQPGQMDKKLLQSAAKFVFFVEVKQKYQPMPKSRTIYINLSNKFCTDPFLPLTCNHVRDERSIPG
jgi:hypothetical protein